MWHANGQTLIMTDIEHRTNSMDDARKSAIERVRRVVKRAGGLLKGDRQIAIVYKMLTKDQKPKKMDKQFIEGWMGEHPYYHPIESYEVIDTPDGFKIIGFKEGSKTPTYHKY